MAQTHKQPITLRLAPDALARWRASGRGWQTRAAALLATHAP
ncbi:MAG: BrnA antitoxin family protein [Burkholderiaceae bacterium]|nr:BrnA antitoxin family protein [Burkholderiaceae bacterium]